MNSRKGDSDAALHGWVPMRARRSAAGGGYSRNGIELDIPAKGSLTPEAWARQAADSIDRRIDKTIGKAEQARYAAELSRDFIVAARNALANPNTAGKLNLTLPPKIYAQLKAELANPLNGKGGADKRGLRII